MLFCSSGFPPPTGQQMDMPCIWIDGLFRSALVSVTQSDNGAVHLDHIDLDLPGSRLSRLEKSGLLLALCDNTMPSGSGARYDSMHALQCTAPRSRSPVGLPSVTMPSRLIGPGPIPWSQVDRRVLGVWVRDPLSTVECWNQPVNIPAVEFA